MCTHSVIVIFAEQNYIVLCSAVPFSLLLLVILTTQHPVFKFTARTLLAAVTVLGSS